MSKSKKAFNPVEYKNDFMTLANTQPDEAADVAMKWRERFMNQVATTKKSTEQALEIGLAGGTAFAMAFFDGGWEAKRDAMVTDWEDGGAEEAETTTDEHPEPFSHKEGGKDPTKLFGMVDKVLVGTLLLAAAAIFNVFGKRYTPFVRAAALGSASYWAGSVGRNLGYKRKDKALKAAGDEDEEET